MMMGAGVLFMVLILLVVIGVPLLIVVMIAGGGLTALLKSLSNNPRRPASPLPPAGATPTAARQCQACGREVQPAWNVCPTCGAALT